MLHVEGPRTIEEIVAIREKVEGPLTANFHGMKEELTPEKAQEIGLNEARYPSLAANAMHSAAWDVLTRFKRDGYEGVKDFYKLIPEMEANAFDRRGTNRIAAFEKKYLPPEQLKKYK